MVPVFMAGIFLCPQKSLAAANLEVVINEVAWMGTTASANSEWLELYNNTEADIDLSGWTLSASDGTPQITLSGTIAAHGYFLLERTSDESVPTTTANQIYTGALGNAGEILSLKDQDNNLIDSLDGSAGWPAGDNDSKKTMERINPLLDGSTSNWSSSNLALGTPQTVNSVYVPINIWPNAVAGADKTAIIGENISFDGSGSSDSDGTLTGYFWNFGDGGSASGVSVNHTYNTSGLFSVFLTVTDDDGATSSDNLIVSVNEIATTTLNIQAGEVVINEFVSDPSTGAGEWLELYNNTTSTLNLAGLTLEDGVGPVASLAGEISAHGFYVQELSASKLNNDGDKIILKYNGNIIDQVSYGSWDDGHISDNALLAGDPNSVARKINGQDSDIDSSDFALTATPTKNYANLITAVSVPNPPATPAGGGATSGGLSQPALVSFNPSDVVINEFVSDPADGETEWVELYNKTDSLINLKNWQIEDGSGKTTELSGAIYSRQMAVVLSPKGSLNNSGDLIVLKDPADNIIDRVAYGTWADGNIFDNALSAGDPQAVARWTDGIDTDIDYNDFRITDYPTKGLPNIINDLATSTLEIKTASSTEIRQLAEQMADKKVEFPRLVITELLPNPAGSDLSEEFIEIYNPNTLAADLSGWFLDDNEEGSRPYEIPDLVIEPQEYLSFFRKETGLALNNDTDQARLINPLGEVISEVEYKNIKEGLAYALDEKNNWQITSAPTPGEINEIEREENKNENSAVKNKLIKITGIVAVEPGILGAQIFYLLDEDIEVYSYKKDFPPLTVGDVVEVVGELSDGSGNRRIKIASSSNIKIIGRKNELMPVAVSLSEIGADTQGQLVKIAGEIIEMKGNYIFLDDGSDEAKIYLKASAQIDKSLFKEGERIEVVGIVLQSAGGFRLLPRYETDILRVGEVQGAQEENKPAPENNKRKYLLAVGVFVFLFLAWFGYRQIKLKDE